MITREELESREDRALAPCAARSSRSLGRAHPEAEHPYRTRFQRDRDRVIHSAAFRRLEYKTQVFVTHEGDYYRTRLTHTIEAAQIARTLGRVLGLCEDLCEVVALAHDLGHTPFGHSGQDALNECMKEHGGFEHNRQSLRIVEVLERRYPEFPGLNLTFETRESIRKHSWNPAAAVEEGYRPAWAPLLEAQVADVADSIAYDAHDIDDGLKAGLLTEDRLSELELWRDAQEEVEKRYGKGLRGRMRARQAVLHLINRIVTDAVEQTEQNLREARVDSVEKVRASRGLLVRFSAGMERKKKKLEAFLHENVYRDHRVLMMQEKAARFIRALFETYVSNVAQLPPRFRAWADEAGVHRAVADYIAGMTDRYAQGEYKKLFHPFEHIL